MGRIWRAFGLLAGVIAVAVVTPAVTRAAEYEIGRGDVLKVQVVGQAEMTGDFTVDPEGMIAFPVLGKLKAAELTVTEFERKLTTLLADGYLKRPQVSVSVSEYGSQKVFVAGEVLKPGQYALKLDRSLLALLGDIGPLTGNAGHEVIVVRPPPLAEAKAAASAPAAADDGLFPAAKPSESTPAAGKDAGATEASGAPSPAPPAPVTIPGLPFVPPGAEIYRVSLLELQSGNPEKNISLQAGDTVFFPRASQVYVMGSVARPGPYRYQEGMTVLQVLTLAGGATERGSSGRTKFVRIVGGKKVETKAKATDIVQPEDTLYVPERFF